MSPFEISAVCLSVVLLGIAKGGFGGVGTQVALPIMALGVSPGLALGALLPILLTMDAVSVSAHRRHADFTAVIYGLPAAALGTLVGSFLIALIASAAIGGVIGALSILFALMALTGVMPKIDHWPDWTNSLFAGVAGVTSTLAHAGGPPIHIYYLARGFEAARFVATSSVFMAGLNILKIIPYIVVGALSFEALKLALLLAPLAVFSAWMGVLVARRLTRQMFAVSVNCLMLIVGAKLIFDAFSG